MSQFNERKSHFIEQLPETVLDKVGKAIGPFEEVTIQVTTDMADSLRYGSRWLVVTNHRLLVLAPDVSTHEDIQCSMQSLKTVHMEPMVGGGRLMLVPFEGESVCLICRRNITAQQDLWFSRYNMPKQLWS